MERERRSTTTLLSPRYWIFKLKLNIAFEREKSESKIWNPLCLVQAKDPTTNPLLLLVANSQNQQPSLLHSPIWSNIDQYGVIWTNVDQYGPESKPQISIATQLLKCKCANLAECISPGTLQKHQCYIKCNSTALHTLQCNALVHIQLRAQYKCTRV